VALGAAVGVSRRRERFAREDGLARFVKAPAMARRELKAARAAATSGDATALCSSISKAVIDFIGDRLKVGARGMTLGELAQTLRSAGAGDELIERVLSVLSECDLGRFAGDFGSVEAEKLL
jgi:methylthioribose-1-phosphate isomerase